MSLPKEYAALAKSFASKVADTHNEMAKENAKPGEFPAHISISVTDIEKPNKPRARGDLRIQFKIEGNMRNRATLMAALNSVADSDAAPRSVTASRNGFVTHMKPGAHLF